MNTEEYIKTHSIHEYLELLKKYSKDDTSIFNYKEVLYELLMFMYENLSPFYREIILKRLEEFYYINDFKVTKKELINLIDDYYKYEKIDFKVSEVSSYLNIINKSNIKNSSLETLQDANVSYIDGNLKINVPFNGHLTDSIPWVHEITHYRNEIYNESNEFFVILSEGLAFANELIYGDYLKNLGFKNEVLGYQVRSFDGLYDELKSAIHTLRIEILFLEEGKLEQSKFKEFFGDNANYYQSLYNFKYNYDESPRIITTSLLHSIGFLLAMYLLNNYRTSKKYMKVIEEFNVRSMNEDLFSLLKFIGLDRNDKNIWNKLGMGILGYTNELESNIKERILTRK